MLCTSPGPHSVSEDRSVKGHRRIMTYPRAEARRTIAQEYKQGKYDSLQYPFVTLETMFLGTSESLGAYRNQRNG